MKVIIDRLFFLPFINLVLVLLLCKNFCLAKPLLSNRVYIFLFSLLGLVYILGLFVPLMDNDAGHHADIALRMYLTGDYVNLIDHRGDYIDKPHFLFWASALSYHILELLLLLIVFLLFYLQFLEPILFIA